MPTPSQGPPHLNPSQPAPAPAAVATLDKPAQPAKSGALFASPAWDILVLAFLGVECPLSKLYAPRLAELAGEFANVGVRIVGIDSNQQDSLAEIDAFTRLHRLPFPVLKDMGNRLADRLAVKRITEVVVLDRERRVRYRGRADDQYQIGVQRQKPTRRDLAEAVEEMLRGERVSVPETEPVGCFIGRRRTPAKDGKLSYARHVAPILERRCRTCHRRGQAAPFALTTYQDAVDWAETIGEVIEDRRMPPWHADPKYGRFANDPSLTDDERRTLLNWIDDGLPLGGPSELTSADDLRDGWMIGRPDVTLAMPEVFRVPAEGVVEYQQFSIDPGFGSDRWIVAAEIRPRNRAVVHHATLFLTPTAGGAQVEQGSLGSFCVAAMAPGSGPLTLPGGMAKRVPAGWCFSLLVHYVSVGSPQTDRTSIGLKFAAPHTVHNEVATRLLVDEHLAIPPGAADHRVEHSVRLNDEVLLLAIFPHMHSAASRFVIRHDIRTVRKKLCCTCRVMTSIGSTATRCSNRSGCLRAPCSVARPCTTIRVRIRAIPIPASWLRPGRRAATKCSTVISTWHWPMRVCKAFLTAGLRYCVTGLIRRWRC
ncbi:MAG TPA: redoxin domain-containing protein [Pirellulales bacterium]|nr:redoxin domain-containing protein [Pirellulales bacterium]